MRIKTERVGAMTLLTLETKSVKGRYMPNGSTLVPTADLSQATVEGAVTGLLSAAFPVVGGSNGST